MDEEIKFAEMMLSSSVTTPIYSNNLNTSCVVTPEGELTEGQEKPLWGVSVGEGMFRKTIIYSYTCK